MRMDRRLIGLGLGAAPLWFFAAMLISGCAAGNRPPATEAQAHNGAQMWADNCARCHNVRSPNLYSDAQWEAVTMHMRVRANLTPVEYREILAFLKSAR